MPGPQQHTYRARRTPHESPSKMERFGGGSILPWLRMYFPMIDPHTGQEMPNFDFVPLIEAATRTSAKIDLADENEGLLDQVIFGIANPDLCHPGIKDIAEDKELVVLLLDRHLKKSGGLLLLPPLSAANDLQNAHRQAVTADIAAGREPAQMHYANWRQAQSIGPPPGFGSGTPLSGAALREDQGSANASRGGEVECLGNS